MESNEEVQGLHSSLMSEVCTLWRQGHLCDIHLKVQNQMMAAHRVVLAALSPYFRSMFCLQLTESQQSCVTIQGFSPAVVSMVMEYAYTATVHLTEDNVQMLLQAASIMQIESLEHKCTGFLIEQLHPTNCLGIRGCARTFGCKKLYAAADDYCQDHFLEVSQNEEFLHLSSCEVLDFVARDALKVKQEEDVYRAVMRWLDFAPEERAGDMVKIMEKVRLPLVRWDFLMGQVSKHQLFTTNEHCRQYLQQARAFQASLYHPDLISFAFNEASLLAQPRIGFGAPEFLHAIGGETDSRDLVSVVELYNPVTCGVRQLTPMLTPRRSLGVALLDNRIYAVGGSDGNSPVNTVEMYDVEKDHWSPCASLLEPRTSVMVTACQALVFAIGGHDGSRALSTVEMYDADNNYWEPSADLLAPRCMGSCVYLKGHLYVMGGYDGTSDLQTAEKFDSCSQKWSAVASMCEPRSMCGATVLDRHIVVVGGSNSSQCLSTAEMYDPGTDQWTLVHSLNFPRRGLGLAVMDSALYAAGGHDGSKCLRSIEKYSTFTQSWTVVGHLEHYRARFGFV